MKIVSIGPANPLRGGIAKFNESFAAGCIAEGFDTEIVSFTFLYPSFLFPGKSQYADDPPPEGIQINTWIHPLNPINWLIVARRIRKLKPDLVVIHYWMPFFAPVLGFLSRRLKRKTKAKILAITHNLIPHEKQMFSWSLTSYFVKPLDGVVCLSKSVQDDLKIFSKSKKSVYLPHPVYDIYGNKLPRQEAIGHLHLDPQNKYLLFFGLIRKYKGLDLLLKAFAELDLPDAILIVAGEFYDNKEIYDELVKDLEIEESVIFVDAFIHDDEVKYYFSAADMVVQPYITATQSGVTQIAYHFDCPMLVTNTGGLAEIVLHGKTGFVCRKSPTDIADKISRFYKYKMADVMIENIKKEKHRFSWDTFVKQVVKLSESD
ncbi:MAG: glycosyltransferase [Bacteroidales bacterium]|nr:glycosyltransferase [Bacteroidales bacterium]